MTDLTPGPNTLIIQEIAEPSLAFETVAEQLREIGDKRADDRYEQAAAWLEAQQEPEIPSAGHTITDGFVTVSLTVDNDNDDDETHFLIHVTLNEGKTDA